MVTKLHFKVDIGWSHYPKSEQAVKSRVNVLLYRVMFMCFYLSFAFSIIDGQIAEPDIGIAQLYQSISVYVLADLFAYIICYIPIY